MSVENYMRRICKRDTAVYWGNPVPNAKGVMLYDAPVEIGCFWKDEAVLMRDKNGREVMTKAVVYVVQDLDESGVLFHGLLSDLTEAQKDDPRKIKKAYEIKRFLKVPSLHVNGEFNRKVMLSVT